MIGWWDGSKPRTRDICEAFLAGVPLKTELRRDDAPFERLPAVFFGVTPSLKPKFDQVLAQNLPWFYIDNAYFGRGTHFRATRNAKQHSGIGVGDAERFRAFGLPILPWYRGGKHVLITTQSEWWYQLHGMTLADWLDDVVAELREVTDRPIVIRYKPKARLTEIPNVFSAREVAQAPDDRPLAADLRDCWAVVTHSSNSAVEAVLAGIPVFCTSADSAARIMGPGSIENIEAPVYPDGREAWAACLAANQWTLEEMRQGRCWADMGVAAYLPR